MMKGLKDMGSTQERAKELFLEALDRPPEERRAFLANACGSDGPLQARVEKLLAAHEESSGVLKQAAPRLADLGAVDDLEPGDVVGNYRLDRMVGEGGFGRVFLAEQLRPVQRRVAIKVIKLGMDTRQVIARFDAERQALALMGHPNIARVLDAGSTKTGRPFFVMEYVPGRPIVEFCDDKALDLRTRVQIVRDVCAAIQHAHVKGILHRDIKPSNVIVTELDGIPHARVIDFGIAKCVQGSLVEGTALTGEGHLVGTPAYMSPEQAGSAADIDTRSDVYSLGVLLYELLAGRSPFRPVTGDFPSLAELQRRIREIDPERPSLAAAREHDREAIPRELDWIVMRCLEKDRERRYPSAAALALDLQRFLDHEAVDAAPTSKAYRLRKLVRRHRTASSALASAGVALLLGAAGTFAGLLEARAESREARLQADITDAVNDFLTEDLLSAVQPSTLFGKGWDVPMSEVLDAAAARIDEAAAPGGRFERAPRIEARIRYALGTTYLTLGRYSEALRQLEPARDLLAVELGGRHEDVLFCRARIASGLHGLGRYDECEAIFAELLPIYRRRFDSDSRETIALQMSFGNTRRRQGRPAEAAELYREALREARSSLGENDELTVDLMAGLAMVEDALGDSTEAERLFRDVLAARRRSLEPDHPDVIASLQNLGAFLSGEKRRAEAKPLLEEALERLKRVMGPTHPSTIAAVYNLSGIAREEGDYDRAEDLLLEAHAASEVAHGLDHLDTIQIQVGMGRLAEARGNSEEAEAIYDEAIERAGRIHGRKHPAVLTTRKDHVACVYLQGRTEEAHELYEELLADEREVNGPCHLRTAFTLYNLGKVERQRGDEASAEEYLLEILECTEELPVGFSLLKDARSDLASLYNDQGRVEEAAVLLED